MNRSTIAAISTPQGSGGIGVIRISGEASLKIASTLFQRSSSTFQLNDAAAGNRFQSHRFYHGHILDPVTKKRIDEVLLVVMKAPRSYTREDVVEIQSHAGHVVLRQIFEKVLDAGAKIAEPGEFTKRAFLNGRIDLTQAEAVCDIIHAKTETALHLAERQLNGHLKEKLDHVRSVLNDIRIELEVAIDFPEEAGEILQSRRLIFRLKNDALKAMESLLRSYKTGRHFREGARMAVIGKPNVGKSSLMNCLLEKDRAIVTATPGTTRDVIEDTLDINGLPVVIMDTAGVQDSAEEVERLGILKTLESMEHADLILFMVDGSRSVSLDDRQVYDKVKDKAHIVVQNKSDLLEVGDEVGLPEEWTSSAVVRISARKGTNIQNLKNEIYKSIVGQRRIIDEIGAVPNTRHKVRLEKGIAALKRALLELRNDTPAEVVAIDIREAADAVDSIVGYRYSEDILEQIFSRFCIGK